MLHSELPTTLDAMERASLEFDELGRSLNLLASPLRRLPARQQPRGAASVHGAKTGAGAKPGTGAVAGVFCGNTESWCHGAQVFACFGSVRSG